jgi:type IX secretion system substrate protein/Big-like domain-containing protein
MDNLGCGNSWGQLPESPSETDYALYMNTMISNGPLLTWNASTYLQFINWLGLTVGGHAMAAVGIGAYDGSLTFTDNLGIVHTTEFSDQVLICQNSESTYRSYHAKTFGGGESYFGIWEAYFFHNENDPPVITSVSANLNPLNVFINVDFNESMKPEKLDTSHEDYEESFVGIVGSVTGEVPFESEYNRQNKVLTILIQQEMQYSESLAITFNSNVQDVAGNPIILPSQYNFILNEEEPDPPTAIAVSVTLNPDQTTPNSSINVYGNAIYDTGEPVSTGTVLISTNESQWTSSLNSYGYYESFIVAPSSSGYVIVVVDDGIIEGSNQEYLEIDGGGNGNSYDYEYSGIFSSEIELVGDDPPVPEFFTHWIRSDIESVEMYTLLEDLYESVRVKYEWYKPDGSQYGDDLVFDWTDDPEDFGYDYYYWWNFYWGFYVEGHLMADTEGRYNAEVYIKEEGDSYEYIDSDWFVVSYDFVEHQMCEGVENNYPVNPTNTFYQNDYAAYTWSHYSDVSEEIEVKTEWYEPNQELYTSSEYVMEDPGQGYYYQDRMQWTWMYIEDHLVMDKCGEWEIKKYEKDPYDNWDLLYEDSFQILEAPDIIPVISVEIAPQNPEENQEITLSLSASDNTYLENIILYWDDGVLQNQEWNYIINPSFSHSVNIGSYNEGQTIEVYARAFDTSGNQTESTHQMITILDDDIDGPEITNISIQEYNGNGNNEINPDELIIISCDINDESGVSDFFIYIDGNMVDTQGSYYSICGPYEQGNHVVQIEAYDNDNTISNTSVFRSFSVIDLNHSPEINFPDSIIFDEDEALIISFSEYVFDEDGDDLILTFNGNDEIMIEVNGLEVVFVASENWYGSENVTFIIDDQQGREVATDDVMIIVEPINDAPEIDLPDSFSFNEDESLEVDFTPYLYDIDGDELVLSVSESVNIYADIEGFNVTFTALENWNGEEVLFFTVDDQQSRETAMGSVIIYVTPVNDAPEIDLPESHQFDEDSESIVDYTQYITDVDTADELTLSAADNENIEIGINGFIVTYTALENWNGTETVVFTIDDNQSRAIDQDTITVTVNYVNDAPVVNMQLVDFSFDEDTVDNSIELNNVFADVDLVYGDSLVYSYSGNSYIAVEILNGLVTLTPFENWFGSENITFTATDTDDESVSDEVSVTVNNVNGPPIFNLPVIITFNEDETLTLDFSFYLSDEDNDELLLTAENSENVFASVDSFSVTFSSTENWFGSETVTFTVDDQQSRVVTSDDVMIIVEPVNDPPEIELMESFSFDEDENLIVDFEEFVSDVDDVDLVLSWHGNTNIAIEKSDYLVTFCAVENWNGLEVITFTIDDQQSRAVASGEVNVIVHPVNDVPEIDLPDYLSFEEGTSLTVPFGQYIYDADGDYLNLANGVTENIFVEILDLQVTFSAEAGWTGSEYVFFYVNDDITRPEYMDSTLVIVTESWGHSYGDIDDNGFVESYDAALILQYVVGIDPGPGAPLPWEDWQITVADVSGNLEIGAFDSALVLQYVVGIIYAFPVLYVRGENALPEVKLIVEQIDGYLKFYSSGEIYSLEVELDEEIHDYSCNENIMTACHENRLALAAAYPIEGDFLAIPVSRQYYQLDIVVNDQHYHVILDNVEESVNSVSAYPNPFNPVTNIFYELSEDSNVLLEVYNIKGQKVTTLVDGNVLAGSHTVSWNAEGRGSGIYLLRYETGACREMRKILLLK